MAIPGQPTKQLFTPWQEWLYEVSRDGVVVFAATTLLLGVGLLLGGWVGKTPPLDQWFERGYLALPSDLPSEMAIAGVERALQEGDLARVLELLPAATGGNSPDPLLDLIALSDLTGEEKQVVLGLLLSMAADPATPHPALEALALKEEDAPLYANRVLRWIALAGGDKRAAIEALAREAAHPDSVQEKQIYLQFLIDERKMEEALTFVRTNEMDPQIAAALEYTVLAQQGDWVGVAGKVATGEVAAWGHGVHLMLALLGLFVWFSFLMQQMASPDWRWGYALMGALGVFLGAVSVVPTMILVLYQDTVLGMELNGDAWNDFLYFFLGVGFREEFAKLLCLLPLTPFLLRASRLHQLVLAACVGLGFGFQENLQYFSNQSSVVAYARVLSANFLHLSLTGVVGLAWFDLFRRGARALPRFLWAFFAVILLHAVYDLFLVNERMARMPFIVIACLSLMAVWFFTELRRERGPQLDFLAPRTLLQLGLAAIFAGTIVVAATELGFFLALITVAASTVGLASAIAIFYILSDDVSLEEYTEGEDRPRAFP